MTRTSEGVRPSHRFVAPLLSQFCALVLFEKKKTFGSRAEAVEDVAIAVKNIAQTMTLTGLYLVLAARE